MGRSTMSHAGKTKNYDLRKGNTNTLLEFYNKPNKDEKFKMTKFKGASVPRVNTNLQAFGLSSIKQI